MTSRDLLAWRRARRALAEAIGRDELRALHRADPRWDLLALVSLLALVAALGVALATLPLGLAWLVAFALQGFWPLMMGNFVHDALVHRRMAGRRSDLLALLLLLPVGLTPSRYRATHLAHHAHLGTPADSEQYKQHLDTLAKRWLFLTMVGLQLAYANRLGPRPAGPSPARWRWEARLLWAFQLTVVAGALAWPPLLYGYVLPCVVMMPIANALRVVLEHGEADPENPYHLGTAYRSGPLVRLLMWNVGDAHLVHHFFPAIPFYRMARAVRRVRPLLARHGVRERDSLLELLAGFFLRLEPHRMPWSDRATSRAGAARFEPRASTPAVLPRRVPPTAREREAAALRFMQTMEAALRRRKRPRIDEGAAADLRRGSSRRT